MINPNLIANQSIMSGQSKIEHCGDTKAVLIHTQVMMKGSSAEPRPLFLPNDDEDSSLPNDLLSRFFTWVEDTDRKRSGNAGCKEREGGAE